MKIFPTFLAALISIFSGTLAVMLLGVSRQMIVAALFGVDRAVDLYLLVVSFATLSVFVFSFVIENAAIPALVERRDGPDADAFGRLGSQLFAVSLVSGVVLAILFIIALPIVAPVLGAGLTLAERARLSEMSLFFIPWIVAVLPFYALSAIHKARKAYSRFLLAEIVVMAVSIVVVILFHPAVEYLALAYGAGYVCGIASLLPLSRVRLTRPNQAKSDFAVIAKPIRQLTGSVSISAASSMADRFVQSFLPAGGISANGYSGLLVASTSTLLGFRDIFVVPFSEPHDRNRKLERALIGLAMLAIPVSVGICREAASIVSFLFERGNFGAHAVDQTAQLLQIQALSIVSSCLMSPMHRMLQVIDRIRLGSLVFVVLGVCIFGLGSLFVIVLGWGLVGYAIASVASSYATLGFLALCLSRVGFKLDGWRILGYCAYALAAAVLAAALSAAIMVEAHPLVAFAGRCTIFAAVIVLAYGLIYRRLLKIIYSY